MDLDLFEHVENKVLPQWNEHIANIPDAEEIHDAIKGLSADSSPGQDAFTGHFFLRCWDIIKDDLQDVVTGFFKGDHIPRCMATTLLILIPKVPDPDNLSQFRPISLSHFISKMITRIKLFF